MISKITAVNIVHNVIAAHLHGEWNEEEQAQVFSAWDWELCEINKEICQKIRDEANGIWCDECEVAKYHNLEDDDTPCQNCGEDDE